MIPRTAALASLLFLALLAPSHPVFAGGNSDLSTPDGVRRLLQGFEITPAMQALPKESPEFPIVAVAQAMKAAHAEEPKTVVQILEPLLTQFRFDGAATQGVGPTSQLFVGNVGSFGLWREIAYLELGEAYYKLGRNDDAISFLGGIPKGSSLYGLATVELTWAELRKRNPEGAAAAIHRLEADSEHLSSSLRSEFNLAQAFYALETGDFEKAASLAESTELAAETGSELKSIRIKLMAQSNLSIYLKKTNSLAFEEKRALIGKILEGVDQVSANQRDSEFSFLVAETYWHLASVLRIEDPERFKSESLSALKHADSWIAPWVNRSLSEHRPYVSEDALFLSVTTLWEQRRFAEALPRLLALPGFFPKGQFLQDTYQLLADYYFDSGEYTQAQKYYGELARVGNDEKAAYGVYKAAWTFYNQDEKWKALRHLERLLLHYRADVQGSDVTLVKEAQNDMLLIMAELLPYRAAFQEIELFGFQKEKKLEIRERLATVYKEIGKYEDSVSAFQTLLAEYGKLAPPEAAFKWIDQLTLVLLSSGKRDAIAPAIDRFVPSMPKADSDDTRKLHEQMEKQLVTVALTVHREAKKTDDADIWRATDAIYKSFTRNFPDSAEADIWYYGAQRKEQLGSRMEAMQWYQKASAQPAYPNRSDAALNVLRLARDLSTDKAFIAQQKNPAEFYSGLASAAESYITAYHDTKERALAELLLLDFHCKAGECPKADRYLVDAVRAEGATATHQEQYLEQNHRLYEARKWEEANALATDFEHVLGETASAAEFLVKVRSFDQETAFQAAFAHEQKDKPKAREWYAKAIQAHSDPTVALKAWHNLLLTFQLPGEAQAFTEKLQEFETSDLESKTHGATGTATLAADIHARAGEVWDTLGFPIRRAEALAAAAKLQPDPTKSDALHWEAALSYGNYYLLDKMKAELAALQTTKHGAAYFNTKNLVTVARLFFWNGAVTEAWDAAKDLVAASNAPPQAWILIGDIYVSGKNSKSLAKQAVYTAAREFLTRNQKQLLSNPILQPIYADLLFPNVDPAKLGKLAEEALRGPAGEQTAATTPQQQLKLRVEMAARVIRELDRQRTTLRTYTGSPISQISISALCAAPMLRQDAIRHLTALKSPALSSAQWPEFTQKLDVKLSEMQNLTRQEQASCDQHRQNLMYTRATIEAVSPLCDGVACFPERPEQADSLMTLEEGWRKVKPTRLDRVYRYLTIGAWAPAELAAYSSQSAHERALLLGLIRLAMGDTWNSAPLLKDAEQEPQLLPHARLFLAAIAASNGYAANAARDLASVSPDARWEDWESSLLSKLRTAPPSP